ncbi:LamG domain-containing protein [Candidatus Poribacteria bacterium]
MTRFCLIVFTVIVILSGSFLAQAQTDGLLLYLPFDDGSGDIATNTVGDDGVLMDSPQWVAGKFGGALEFNGTSNYVDVPLDLSPQAPGNQGAISICAWVKVLEVNTDTAGQTRQPIVMKGNSGEWEYALYVHDDFGAGMSVWDCGGTGVAEPSAAGTLPQGEWHHVCSTFDVTNGVTVYVDTVEVAQQAPNGNEPCDGTFNVLIASRIDGQFLQAVIDEVAIWDRVLSITEIEQNMVGGLTTAVEPGDKLTTTWAAVKDR